jgi:hypothetical protein
LRDVLDSLVDVLEGGLGLSDLIVDGGEFGLGVGELSLSDGEGSGDQMSGLVVGLDSLVFSESLEIEALFDFVDELIEQFQDSL